MKNQLNFFKTFELSKTQKLSIFAGGTCASDCEKEYKAIAPKGTDEAWIKATCAAACNTTKFF